MAEQTYIKILHPVNYSRIMLWAACCLIFAFLWPGEMTVPTVSSFDPSRHLTPKDIAMDSVLHPNHIQLLIEGSKMDQTRQCVRLYVGRANNDLCPVAAMLTYLVCRGLDDGPLFRTKDGQPLTRSKLVDLLRSTLSAAGIDPARYSGHSFHIGVATTAAAHGINDSTIQTLGRWTSFLRYIRIPRHELAQLSTTLGQSGHQ